MSGECAAETADDALDANRDAAGTQVGPNNTQHPPGLSDPAKESFIKPILAAGGTANGQVGADEHCPNP